MSPANNYVGVGENSSEGTGGEGQQPKSISSDTLHTALNELMVSPDDPPLEPPDRIGPLPPPFKRGIKSFVLRQSHMTEAQERALNELGQKYVHPTLESPVSPHSLFTTQLDLILEIGFGMGHATAEIARHRPDCNFIAIDVHLPGVGALLDRIKTHGIENLRILRGDAVKILESMFVGQDFNGVHIFFPDPWPKKRHHKRRLITKEFLDFLALRCKPGAYLYLTTDWEDYATWMLDALQSCEYWQNQYPDWSPPVPWRPMTAFERKGLQKQHLIRELFALRKAQA